MFFFGFFSLSPYFDSFDHYVACYVSLKKSRPLFRLIPMSFCSPYPHKPGRNRPLATCNCQVSVQTPPKRSHHPRCTDSPRQTDGAHRMGHIPRLEQKFTRHFGCGEEWPSTPKIDRATGLFLKFDTRH